MRSRLGYIVVVGWAMLLVACNPDTLNNPQEIELAFRALSVEADRPNVSVVRAETADPLPTGEPVWLNRNETLQVDINGRARLGMTDILALDLVREGNLFIDEVASDGQGALVRIRQSGGVLLSDFNPALAQNRRLVIQTSTANVATSGSRFAVIHSADTGLTWVVGMETGGRLQITAAGVTEVIAGGTARWIVAGEPPSEQVPVDRERFEAWLLNVQSGAIQLELAEVLLSPANIVGSAAGLTLLPNPGQPFELGRNAQGAVRLTLDAVGLFGNPTYDLQDCDGDGTMDLVLEAGRLLFDFRSVMARVPAVDVTVFNFDQPGQGALWGRGADPEAIDRQLVAVGPGGLETLSIRTGLTYYSAELMLNNGCFISYSLTPPSPTGEAPEPRQPDPTQAGGVIVNRMEGAVQNIDQSGQIEAMPLGAGTIASIQIDGNPDEWDTLAAQTGRGWLRFDTITHNDACTNRFPDSTLTTDLSGRVQFAYDSQALYVAFLVEDDGFTPYGGADLRYFLGDGPQLSLDTDLLGDLGSTEVSSDDVQIDFLPIVGGTQIALWQLSPLDSRAFNEARAEISFTTTGYFLEAVIPWRSLGLAPQPGDRFGIAANINDNDSPDFDAQQCIISTAPRREWDNPSTWGTLLLRPMG